MPGDKKAVTIHYRRVTAGGPLDGGGLEAAIRAAMEIQEAGHSLASRARARIWRQGEDNLFVNLYHDGGNLLFGDITHFTGGHLQALLDAAQLDEPFAPVEQMPAPAAREYIHSLMYWMVKGNHVFVIQSAALRTDSLEDYLTWLLTERSGMLQQDFRLVLAMQFDETEVGGDIDDIQELVIGGTVAAMPQAAVPAPVPAPDTVEQGSIGRRRTTGWAQAREILSVLMDGEANVDAVMDTVPDNAELSVEVHIGYKTRRRGVDRMALKQLETGLRHLPDSQLHVKAKGQTLKDGRVRLHYDAGIALKEVEVLGDGTEPAARRRGSLLDPADVLRAMTEAYNVFVANGKIVPD